MIISELLKHFWRSCCLWQPNWVFVSFPKGGLAWSQPDLVTQLFFRSSNRIFMTSIRTASCPKSSLNYALNFLYCSFFAIVAIGRPILVKVSEIQLFCTVFKNILHPTRNVFHILITRVEKTKTFTRKGN
jgi:hypothetical protein